MSTPSEVKQFCFPDGYVKQPLPDMKEWVAALRSGKYTQTTGFLARHDPESGKLGHCCLGVLCEVQGRRRSQPIPHAPGIVCFDYQSKKLASTNPARDYMGMCGNFPTSCWVFDGKTYWTHLADMNDNGFTFAEIADVIEAVWFDPGPESPSAEKPPQTTTSP